MTKHNKLPPFKWARRVKLSKPIAFMATVLTSLSLFGLSETIDGITWKYDCEYDSNGELVSVVNGVTVPASTTGAMEVPYVLGSWKVAVIGRNAFYGCSWLKSIKIPSDVTIIRERAFYGCKELTSITIPSSVTSVGAGAFEGCVKLSKASIKGPVSYIGSRAFYNCGLKSITIPNTLSCIEPYTFYGCNNLTSIVIPARTTVIRDYAFYGCSGLTNVVVSSGVMSIGDYSFSECTHLMGVVLPESLTRIGAHAFNNCKMLANLSIPYCVTSIGCGAFDGCLALPFDTTTTTGATMVDGWIVGYDDSLSSILRLTDARGIMDCTLAECSGLTNVVLASSIICMGDNDFRCVGKLANGKVGLWIQDGWVLGYIGEAPATVAVPEGVLGIASYAFAGQIGLENVLLPSTLKYIGVNAFMGCTALADIDIPDAVENIDNGAFKNCTWLQDLKLSKTLKTIGMESFANCAMLPNLICEEGLVAVGGEAFSNCWRMLSVNLPASVMNIDKTAFADCKRLTGVYAPTHVCPFGDLFPASYANLDTVVVPEGETVLMDNALKGCTALVNVSLPESITQVGSCAFYGCTALTSISLPDGITRIGNSAFQGCVVLESVKLPKRLMELGNSSFKQCSALEHLALPNTIERIGDYAFYDDNRLEEINLPILLKHVGAYAFYNCAKITSASFAHGLLSIGEKAYGNCGFIRDVYIPSSVTSLGSSIFYNCSAITNITTATAHRAMADMFPKVYNQLARITIASGETKVCDNCFANCAKLSEIGLPDTITTMGNNAFSGCTVLSNVALSKHLQGLPDYAFKNCKSLATLTVPESVSSLGKNVFDGCSKLESIYFVGNAPQYNAAVFSGIASGTIVFVVNGSTGWDGVTTSRALPDSWPTSNSREITYWTPNRYNVIFDANGGTPATNILEEITGMTYTLPVSEPTMSGATFLGWWTEMVNGARVTAGTQVTLTRTHTFYAHWAANLYHVAFDANGGLGEMAEQTYVVGEQSELPLNLFARYGFAFAGWALEPNGEAVYVDGSPVVDLTLESDATVTLYAVWNEQAWATGDYMNSPGRMFVMGGDEDWRNDVVNCHDGIGSMRSGEIGHDGESVMSTTVVGEGDVSFWWKVSCEEPYKGDRYDYVYFAVDGVECSWLAGEVDWKKVTFHVTGSGQHTLTWCYHKDDWDEEGYGGGDCAWVDEFKWIPVTVRAAFDGNGNTAGSAPRDVVKYEGYSLTMPGAGTLERFSYVFSGWSDGTKTYAPGSIYVFTGHDVVFSAVWIEKVWTYADFLNSTNLLFTTAVGAEWHGDFVTNHDWVVSAKSAAIDDGQSSWIQGMISGAGTLSFCTKVSGETKRGRLYDYLDVTVDGVSVFASADTDWTNVVVEVSGQGEHAIRWAYTKDGSNSVGDDCAWLDEVMWTLTDPIPPIVSDSEVLAALTGTSDVNLAANVTNAAQYAAYRAWALSVTNATTPAQMIKESTRTWLSYAFAADALIDKELTSDDVKIESFTPASTDGKFEFTVSVKDVNIGGGSVAVETLKENLKKVLGIEGAATLSSGGFSSDNIDITFDTPVDGKARFTVTPPADAGNSFFMRVKVK